MAHIIHIPRLLDVRATKIARVTANAMWPSSDNNERERRRDSAGIPEPRTARMSGQDSPATTKIKRCEKKGPYMVRSVCLHEELQGTAANLPVRLINL